MPWLEKEDEEGFPEAQPSKAPFGLQGKAGLRHLHPWAASAPSERSSVTALDTGFRRCTRSDVSPTFLKEN